MVLESAEAFQLREPGVSYLVDFSPKNDDIGAENEYLWNNNLARIFHESLAATTTPHDATVTRASGPLPGTCAIVILILRLLSCPIRTTLWYFLCRQ